MNKVPHSQRIRSFVRRQGRITRSQQLALDELYPRYAIEAKNQLLDLNEIFGREAPCILEIGFGNGVALAEMAANHPQTNYLGIEVHHPGVGNLLQQIERQGLGNVRVICADAVDVLTQQIPDCVLDAVYLFFPDPWHKRRHHKRRLVQEEFITLVERKLKPGGILHMATDWEDYAIQMLHVLSAATGFENTAGPGQFTPRPDYRPLTKFEQRGQRLGHGVWDLVFSKKSC